MDITSWAIELTGSLIQGRQLAAAVPAIIILLGLLIGLLLVPRFMD